MPADKHEMAGYVLAGFRADEQETVRTMVDSAYDVVLTALGRDLDAAARRAHAARI